MKFNPPPNWPDLPDNWEPGPQWQPPKTWPAAPPGWRFWTNYDTQSQTSAGTTETEPSALGGEPPSRKPIWRRSTTVLLALGIAASLVVAFVVVRVAEPLLKIKTLPQTDTLAPSAPAPGWRPPSYFTPLYIDFASWTAFGGISAEFGDNGESVILNTDDTTATWPTKWSGLISRKTTTCAARIVGQARDISHNLGRPGGFSIGLGAFEEGDPKNAVLTGTAIQFDFGQLGFSTAVYPSDADHGLQPALLDHLWHEVEVIIDADSHTLIVDGQAVAETQAGGQCGQPFVRVWAGSAEFADFTVTPLD